jgi:hypothetical protein
MAGSSSSSASASSSIAPIGRCAPVVGAGVAELGPGSGASAAGVTGVTAVAATGVVAAAAAAGCGAHCIGVVVAGLVAALGGALGLERRSEEVARGESSVPARGFLPRLAAEEEGLARGLPLVVAEAPGFDGFAGMKVRS